VTDEFAQIQLRFTGLTILDIKNNKEYIGIFESRLHSSPLVENHCIKHYPDLFFLQI